MSETALAQVSQGLTAGNQSQAGGLVETQKSRAIAEVQAAMVVAKQFPRNQKDAIDRILNSCTRKGLAEVAVYEYSKGGSKIEGPSIRLAECIAQNWGNLQYGIREIEDSGNESTIEAFAWDVETNTRQTKTFRVPHARYTRAKGMTKFTDPREVYEMNANMGARRMRACILGVIPGDVVDEAVAQCNLTLKQHADVTPERIKGMLKKFEEVKVSKKNIEDHIQRNIESITPALFIKLGKIYLSIKEGMGKPADYFDIGSSGKKEKKESPLAKAGKVAKTVPEPEPLPEPEKVETAEEKAESEAEEELPL